MPGFAQVRRMEAVSFRSWPAATTYFDGTWAIRLTAGHPAKRLNSVNPLDPFDTADLESRVERAQKRFEAFGRPLIFRHSPLAPKPLDALLDDRGWSRFDETIVMRSNLAKVDLSSAIDRVPLKDVGRWIDDVIAMGGAKLNSKPGLSELIGAIEPKVGLFALEREPRVPLSALMCVHDRALAGVFQMISNPDERRQGFASDLLATAMLWAHKNGAKNAWLQVESDNEAAIALYRSFGFTELYRYTYRGAPSDE